MISTKIDKSLDELCKENNTMSNSTNLTNPLKGEHIKLEHQHGIRFKTETNQTPPKLSPNRYILTPTRKKSPVQSINYVVPTSPIGKEPIILHPQSTVVQRPIFMA